MTFFGKEFTQSFKSLKKKKLALRLEHDVCLRKFREVKDELSPTEIYIFKQRIKDQPLSMTKIAEGLKKEGLKQTEVTRQNIDISIKRALKRLNK